MDIKEQQKKDNRADERKLLQWDAIRRRELA
jgi:hypothetical protein